MVVLTPRNSDSESSPAHSPNQNQQENSETNTHAPNNIPLLHNTLDMNTPGTTNNNNPTFASPQRSVIQNRTEQGNIHHISQQSQQSQQENNRNNYTQNSSITTNPSISTQAYMASNALQSSTPAVINNSALNIGNQLVTQQMIQAAIQEQLQQQMQAIFTQIINTQILPILQNANLPQQTQTQQQQNQQQHQQQPNQQHQQNEPILTQNSDDDGVVNNQQQEEEEDVTPIENVMDFQEFQSIPVSNDLAGVPAHLMADIDSATIVSSSITKIIANINYKDKCGEMQIQNNFDRRYCNTSSRYYVKPSDTLPLQYANGNRARNPIRLSHMPNIRLFPITTQHASYTLSLYVLDENRRLGKDTTFLTDRTLLCVVIAFNIVRHHWNSFASIWSKFYSFNDKHEIGQIMQNIQTFYIQKPGAVWDKSNVTINLKCGAMILVMFERAMLELASEWKNDYTDTMYNGGFTSIKDRDFATSEVQIKKHAKKICNYWIFELGAIGIKFRSPKLQAFLPNLRDETDFLRKHKILCRLVTQEFKEKINKNKKQKTKYWWMEIIMISLFLWTWALKFILWHLEQTSFSMDMRLNSSSLNISVGHYSRKYTTREHRTFYAQMMTTKLTEKNWTQIMKMTKSTRIWT